VSDVQYPGIDHGTLSGLADDDHSQYSTDADLTTHEGDTTAVHGIADTSLLAGHIEAKETPGVALSETVTWTTAFSSVPIVTDAGIESGSDVDGMVAARSTSGATLENRVGPIVKMCIAREAT